MLNITDVRKRLKENPEPKEVEEIRNKIISSFNKLEFIEDGHKYFLHEDDGTMTQLKSVSETIHQFVPEVDWDDKAHGCALKEGVDVSVIKRRWEENNVRATNNGTSTHLFGEMYHWFVTDQTDKFCDIIQPQYEKGYLIPYGEKQNASQQYNEDLFNVHDMYPLMVETQVYTKKYAGTFDKLIYYKHPTDEKKSGLILADYKGLALDTPIATKEGWTTMSEIKVGDEVFDKNGNLTKVLNVSSIHNNPCLKIKFDNNTEIICDDEHRWEVSFSRRKMVNGKFVNTFITQVMTTRELQQQILKYKQKRFAKDLPKIFLSKPLSMPHNELPIHPYVLGVWLGDGNKCDGKITNMYDNIWKEIEKCGYKIGKDVSQGGAGKAQTRTVFGLTQELRKLGLLFNKHIPDIFLRSSYNQRLDILKGIMDSDGYYNKKRNRYVISTTKKEQVDFCVKILSSLGIKPTVIECLGKCNNCPNKKIFNKWDITYTTDIYPFKVRNIETIQPKNIYHLYYTIKDVEEVDSVPTKCIEVDSPTHTYCFGYNMIVTHNTNKDLTNDYNRSHNTMMLPPFDDYIDEALSHYICQLSAYQIPLEDIGLKILARRIIWLKSDGTYEQISVPDVTNRLRQVFNLQEINL